MPDCDGIDVVQELPAASPRPRVRFVTGGPMTNALTARLIAQARDIDTGRFLTKPVTVEELQNTLSNEKRMQRAAVTLDRGVAHSALQRELALSRSSSGDSFDLGPARAVKRFMMAMRIWISAV